MSGVASPLVLLHLELALPATPPRPSKYDFLTSAGAPNALPCSPRPPTWRYSALPTPPSSPHSSGPTFPRLLTAPLPPRPQPLLGLPTVPDSSPHQLLLGLCTWVFLPRAWQIPPHHSPRTLHPWDPWITLPSEGFFHQLPSTTCCYPLLPPCLRTLTHLHTYIPAHTHTCTLHKCIPRHAHSCMCMPTRAHSHVCTVPCMLAQILTPFHILSHTRQVMSPMLLYVAP